MDSHCVIRVWRDVIADAHQINVSSIHSKTFFLRQLEQHKIEMFSPSVFTLISRMGLSLLLYPQS